MSRSVALFDVRRLNWAESKFYLPGAATASVTRRRSKAAASTMAAVGAQVGLLRRRVEG
jgi:hypothetical protein